MTAHNDLSDGAQVLLAALKQGGSGEVNAVDLVEEEVIFDELAVLEYALELLRHGEPIRVHSGLASDWAGYAVQGFGIALADTREQLVETQESLDQHIAEMQAARAGLQRAAGTLAG